MPVMTRAERLQDQAQLQKDIWFAKVYWLFLLSMFLLATIAATFREDPDSIETIHAEICDHNQKSPLCADLSLLKRVDTIASKKKVPTRLVIGIWNAESTLGTNFNKWACASYNNWAWLKGRKFDDGRVEMYAVNRRKPDKNGCWLYRFDSVEQATESLVNTIAIGYKGCAHKTECIAYDFVGNPNVAERSWIQRVEKFYS